MKTTTTLTSGLPVLVLALASPVAARGGEEVGKKPARESVLAGKTSALRRLLVAIEPPG